jgi:selenocysteine-specific elongation factor
MSTTRTHAVIGTAGHVDHGKTSLVRALTGVDCDRLAEEKRRGITIELGFARWDLGAGLSASIVDVPGHERFVDTMVAGATGLDLVMLIVAADDGVMPQTREHLAICEELGVSAGVAVITKCDLVDSDLRALVVDEVKELARSTFLEGAPVVAFSTRDESSHRELTRVVATALPSLASPIADGPPWLAIDRVFVKRGFGTIATGTLVRGSLALEDELVVLPTGEAATVRGLAVHDRTVDRACATTRVAVNLRGAERSTLDRGYVLTRRGVQSATRAIDVELHLFPDARALGTRTTSVLHLGTTRATVRARPFSPISPGETGIVRLTSATPFVAFSGQRFVLRRPDLVANRTIAGGTVVDPHPARSRKSHTGLAPSADLETRVTAIVDGAKGGVTLAELSERLPFGADGKGIASRLAAQRRVIDAQGSTFFSVAHFDAAKSRLVDALARFHVEHHALSGATAADLEGALPARLRPLTARAIAALGAERRVIGGDRIRLPSHDAARLSERVAEIFERAALEPPAEEETRARAGIGARELRDVVAELVRRGVLARVANGVYFHRRVLDRVKSDVAAHLDQHPSLSPGDFKTLTGLTRRHAIALLEWLDKEGVTKRRGDLRVRA